jgi:hypothetical protein
MLSWILNQINNNIVWENMMKNKEFSYCVQESFEMVFLFQNKNNFPTF